MISLAHQIEENQKKKEMKEDDFVRVKDLESILAFPPCPQNSSESRGYVNTVLTMIGTCQKTKGARFTSTVCSALPQQVKGSSSMMIRFRC